MKRLLLFVAIFANLLSAAEYGPLPAPTSAATITSTSSRINYIRLVNVGGGTSLYCVLLDRTTNCSGAGCPIFKATFSADPQTYSDAQPGTLAASGFTVQCSATGATVYVQYQKAVP